MKINRRTSAIVAALAIATTGALTISQKADAATVATTHSGTYSSLYRSNGSIISNRALGPNTPWRVGKIATINGETMYQVSTNEYLRARDSSLNGQQTPTASTKLVGTTTKQIRLYNRRDAKMASNRALGAHTAWQIGNVIKNKQGITFVQVSTNEYANAADMTFNHALTPTYVEDFGSGNDFAGSTDTSTSTDTNTNTGSNVDTNTSTNTNQNQTTTTPDTNTNNGGSSSSSNQGQTDTPDLAAVQSAVIASVNAERQSKGLAPLTVDSRLSQAGMVRAKEVSSSNSHTRPNGTQWYTAYADAGIANPESLHVGENVFGTPWNQLSVQTPEHYAQVVMNNYKGETFANNHYEELTKADFTKIGVGTYYNPSTHMTYITEEFTN